MKKIYLIILTAILLVACNGANKNQNVDSKKLTPQSAIDWMGTYESDSVKIKFKKNGLCEVTTPEAKLNGDYSWDVDGTTICVVDEHHTIYWLRVYEGYMLTSDSNSKFIKIK